MSDACHMIAGFRLRKPAACGLRWCMPLKSDVDIMPPMRISKTVEIESVAIPV